MTDAVFWYGYALAWIIIALLAIFYFAKVQPRLALELRWLAAIGAGILLGLLWMQGVSFYPAVATDRLMLSWGLDREGNIPTHLATILFFFVSWVALRLALAPQAIAKRLIWGVFALTYFIFALDEHLEIHESWFDLYNIGYPIIVGGLFLSLMFYWVRADKPERFSLGLVLTGLMLSVVGGFLLDVKAGIRIPFPLWTGELHIDLHSAEEMLEMIGTLGVALGALHYGSHRVKTWSIPRIFRLQLLLLPCLAIISFRYLEWMTPNYERLVDAEPVHLTVREEALIMQGFDLPKRYQLSPDGSDHLLVHTFYRTAKPLQRDFGHSLQLIDQETGELLTFDDDRNARLASTLVNGRTYRQIHKIPNLRKIPRHRALWLSYALWYEDEAGEFINYTFVEGDPMLLSERQAVLTELVLKEDNEIPTGPILARFENGSTLHEPTLPELAHPGADLKLTFLWSSAAAGVEDMVQFLHFHHEESDFIWVHDQPPLGARLPTRLWYPGLVDQETWQITLPADMPKGRYQLYTGLYRNSDTERIAAYDASGNEIQDDIIPLGSIEIRN
ncbi:MAG: hypothetical protein OXF22_05425 [Anaerolineaceae bacterium]|nr:hypothetical protein [Anaerolineaceae bacterium]